MTASVVRMRNKARAQNTRQIVNKAQNVCWWIFTFFRSTGFMESPCNQLIHGREMLWLNILQQYSCMYVIFTSRNCIWDSPDICIKYMLYMTLLYLFRTYRYLKLLPYYHYQAYVQTYFLDVKMASQQVLPVNVVKEITKVTIISYVTCTTRLYAFNC